MCAARDHLDRDRRLLAAVWLATAVIVAVGCPARLSLPDAGSTRWRAPATRLTSTTTPRSSSPTPALLGTAVEVRVTEAVRACMAEAGYDFRGPAVLSDLDALLDPAADGYGIAAGPDAPRPQLGEGGPGGADQAGYEEASVRQHPERSRATPRPGMRRRRPGRPRRRPGLAGLAALFDRATPGGRRRPPRLGRRPGGLVGMHGGARASPPPRPTTSSPPRPPHWRWPPAMPPAPWPKRERAAAAADFACRASTLDPALEQVAADLAPAFVDRNRTQLEALIPSPGGPPADQGLGTGDVQVTLRWGHGGGPRPRRHRSLRRLHRLRQPPLRHRRATGPGRQLPLRQRHHRPRGERLLASGGCAGGPLRGDRSLPHRVRPGSRPSPSNWSSASTAR